MEGRGCAQRCVKSQMPVLVEDNKQTFSLRNFGNFAMNKRHFQVAKHN